MGPIRLQSSGEIRRFGAMLIVSLITAAFGVVLLIAWWRAHRAGDRARCFRLCLVGGALGLAHLLWELYWVKAAGAPPPKGSPEQGALMFRLAGLAFPANLLLVIGIFEFSARAFRRSAREGTDPSI